ncbi:MAG: VCBS repeat-containing protein, partial [Planctomycetales bacterium]|nr:VCBS repeat-containing protein [Planctomycetales bacterium]
MRTHRNLQPEQLEQRCLLTTVGFAPVNLTARDVQLEGQVTTIDLDFDGDLDVVSGGHSDDEDTRLLLNNGDGQPFEYVYVGSKPTALRTIPVDMDNDGDYDLFDGLAWRENLGDLQFSEEHTRILDGNGWYTNGRPVDIDADGDLDLVIETVYSTVLEPRNSRFGWLENKGKLNWLNDSELLSQNFHEIARNARAFDYVDIDQDGFKDLVWAHDQIFWYRHLDGKGTFAAGQLLRENTVQATYRAVQYSDMNGDGRVDIVVSDERVTPHWGNDQLGWYPNLGADGFGDLVVIAGHDPRSGDSSTNTGALAVGDIDGDGDSDIATIFYYGLNHNFVYWLENDGTGSFTHHQVANIHYLRWRAANLEIVDLNGDGDMDIIGASTSGRSIRSEVYFEQRVMGDANGDGR